METIRVYVRVRPRQALDSDIRTDELETRRFLADSDRHLKLSRLLTRILCKRMRRKDF